jgi:hypothetical protein
MSNDPGLAADQCFYIEATAGDGGSHTNPTFWLSPDIQLTGPVSGSDKADPGVDNSVMVRVHRKSGSCTTPVGTESILIDLYVGNPALVMKPNDPSSTTKLTNTAGRPNAFTSPAGLTPAGTAVPITWHPPSPATGPESPGHKCLIVRAYPDSLSPDTGDFHVPDDPHVAQHNICIVPCSGGGGGGAPGGRASGERTPHAREAGSTGCTFDVSTANLSDQDPELATLRVVRDLHPGREVNAFLVERLQPVPGFQRISGRLQPQGFSLHLPDFPNATVRDHSRLGFLAFLLYILFLLLGLLGIKLQFPFPPRYEAQIQLQPGQLTTFTFRTDLSSASRGEAYVYHLMHKGSDQHVKGGLTLLLMVDV